MRERVISAAVIVPVVAIVFLLGVPWLTLGLAVLALLAAIEVLRLLAKTGLPVELLPAVVVAPVAVVGITWDGLSAGWVAAFLAAVLIVLAIDAFRRPVVDTGRLVYTPRHGRLGRGGRIECDGRRRSLPQERCSS